MTVNECHLWDTIWAVYNITVYITRHHPHLLLRSTTHHIITTKRSETGLRRACATLALLCTVTGLCASVSHRVRGSDRGRRSVSVSTTFKPLRGCVFSSLHRFILLPGIGIKLEYGETYVTTLDVYFLVFSSGQPQSIVDNHVVKVWRGNMSEESCGECQGFPLLQITLVGRENTTGLTLSSTCGSSSGRPSESDYRHPAHSSPPPSPYFLNLTLVSTEISQ